VIATRHEAIKSFAIIAVVMFSLLLAEISLKAFDSLGERRRVVVGSVMLLLAEPEEPDVHVKNSSLLAFMDRV
jgi:hypothetical protein